MIIRAFRKMCKGLRLNSLAWKLRKLDLDIRKSDLVLDVGSGSAPNPYADVLVEYDPEGRETNAGRARSNGKVLVWADAQRMPFRNRVFDYSFCFHVLEHVINPAACLRELERVSRRGYIEAPNEIFDFVIPYRDHRNRVSYDGTLLRVFAKKRWDVERFEWRYGRQRAKQVFDLLVQDPASLHAQYYWNDRIEWIFSEEVISDGYHSQQIGEERYSGEPISPWLNTLVTRFIRRRALSTPELLGLMRCVECDGEQLTVDGENVLCGSCNTRYVRLHGFLDFRPKSTAGVLR